MKTKFFTLFFALMASVEILFAESGRCGDNLTWELTNGVLSISGNGNMWNWSSSASKYDAPWNAYKNNITSATIGNEVTSIGNGAFYCCSSLTSVTIGNSVTSIGEYAFYCCSSLTSVTIGNSVTSIGYEAFYGCSSLTSVTIPNSVTSIGSFAFLYCTGLTSVTIPNSVTNIGKGAFENVPNIVYYGTATGSPWGARSWNGYVDGYLVYGDDTQTNLLACSSAATGSITIPNSVTRIGTKAFLTCSGLTSITIPYNVKSIEEETFSGCSGLTGELMIPYSVTSIGTRAFQNCSGLTSVTIGNSVTNIGDLAFQDCSGLTSITCEAETPPTCGYETFYGVKNNIPLYTLTKSVELYRAAKCWKDFTKILPISAKDTETIDVKTTTTENSVDVTWPEVDGAYTYELVIKDKDGNIICTLTFNAQGQLTSIAFNTPAHGDAPQKAQTAGFSFTVTGLEEGTEYNLTITAKNENGQELDKKNVSFHTNWHNALEDIHVDSSKAIKVLNDGKVYILRGDKTYTIQGQEVK